MSHSTRFPLATAQAVAESLSPALSPAVERIAIAGSVRRGRADVGDLDLILIPRVETRADPGDLFGTPRPINLFEEAIAALIKAGTLAPRPTSNGQTTMAETNKLMGHLPTGLPVAFYATNAECWPNLLVCRTGPAELNGYIAHRAKEMGWQWNPYGPGFTSRTSNEKRPVLDEADVFHFVGLRPLLPWERSSYPIPHYSAAS